MYQLIYEKGSLRVLDSTRERFDVKAVCANIPMGYYRVPLIERFAPRLKTFGPGKMLVDRLTDKDVDGLIVAEKAERRYETALKIDRHPVLPIGRPGQSCAIHGGAESLSSTVAVARYQPLTDPACGIRVQNGDFEKIANFLQSRLRIQQLVVLTVLGD